MQERDLGQVLDAFYAEGPRVAADWILDDLRTRIDMETQRVRWRAALRRPKVTPSRLLLVAAIVGALIAASIALLNLGGLPRPVALPALPPPACLQITDGCAVGELPAGEHGSTAFASFGGKRHTLTFTVPEGWANTHDDDGVYTLRPRLDSQEHELVVVASPVIADQQEPCTMTPKPGIGESVDDQIAYVAGHPGLIVNAPQRITINGMPGQYIDVLGVRPEWPGTCIRYTDGPVVMLLIQRVPDKFLWWQDPTEHTRFMFLDAGDGLTIVAIIESRIAELFQPTLDAQMPVVQSFSVAL